MLLFLCSMGFCEPRTYSSTVGSLSWPMMRWSQNCQVEDCMKRVIEGWKMPPDEASVLSSTWKPPSSFLGSIPDDCMCQWWSGITSGDMPQESTKKIH
ncbi:hypothetical protein FGO68_gene14914 [Halteria grandinella]|uniref:Uncharacterized protein n=1 Tax=Halteria grandinella TaxID=5974 RepID=A0A8J8NCV6_HALGN|nr:hypothetical protein FGO68_gene14914 [Halteria grandinella]